MGYPFEDLGTEQFERLVVEIARNLFGDGVQRFATGKDGGRDARFTGTAERFPSAVAGWSGTTVFQAKHTNGFNLHFSDSDFSGPGQTAVLTEEIPKVKQLRADGELDNYMLLSNRRLGAEANARISKRISEECQIPSASVHLCGVEGLNDWINKYPTALHLANLSPIESPLIVTSDELAEIVDSISHNIDAAAAAIPHPPVARTSYDEKNRINNLSPEYARAMRRRYLREADQIASFLAAPGNARLLDLYEGAVEEFTLKIIAKREEYQKFDDVFNYLFDLLFARDTVLRANKRLTKAVVFYMYWNCDLGETDDVATD